MAIHGAAVKTSKIHETRPSVFAGGYYRDLSGLESWPIAKDWIIEGAPEATAKYLMETHDGTSFTVVWDCTAGSFRWHYGQDETVYIVSGEVFIRDDSGEERRLGEGDMAFFPAGSSALWRIPKRVRKIAVLQRVNFPKSVVYILRAWISLRHKLGAAATALGIKELIDRARRSKLSA